MMPLDLLLVWFTSHWREEAVLVHELDARAGVAERVLVVAADPAHAPLLILRRFRISAMAAWASS